jgi:hypothetical protein
MIEKIESKRHKLRGYDRTEDMLNPGGTASSYPFTPKNSYVDSSMDNFFDKQSQQQEQETGNILHAIDSEVLHRKLMEKQRRGDSNPNSNMSSKSQSLSKLNVTEEMLPSGDNLGSQLSPTILVPPPQAPEEK